MNGTRDTLSLDHAAPTPKVSGARPRQQTVQVVRRSKDDVCFSQESRGREEEESAQSICSNFMAAWG